MTDSTPQHSQGVPRLVLGSSSPRRSDLLLDARVAFEVITPDVDETPLENETPIQMVERLARLKADNVLQGLLNANPGSGLASRIDSGMQTVVVTADTTVDLDGQALGKPTDRADATSLLAQIAGRDHLVHSAVVVATPDHPAAAIAAVETTRVTMVSLTESEISSYAKTGEPLDKAGAYAIQGIGGRYVKSIEGNYQNVVGLPLATLDVLLRRSGFSLGLGDFTDTNRPVTT